MKQRYAWLTLLLLLSSPFHLPWAKWWLAKLVPSFKSDLTEKVSRLPWGPHYCIWQISSKTTHLYLVGSLHALPASSQPYPPIYEAIYRDSDRVVEELNPAQYVPGIDAQIAQGNKLPSSGSVETKRLPADASIVHGLDYYFGKKALQDNKDTDGLETADQQKYIIQNLPSPAKWILVMSAMVMSNHQSAYSIYVDELRAFMTGDAQQASSLALGSALNAQMNPDGHRQLISDRSADWADQLTDYLDGSDRCMVIVGVGHLCNSDGLLALLAQKGYRVEPLTLPPSQRQRIVSLGRNF